MSTRFYFIFSASLLILFSIVLFFDIGKEEKNSNLWEEAWEMIEYIPDKTKATKIRFIRIPGFFRDEYFVENIASPLEKKGENKKKRKKQINKIRYPGNHFVKNIFSEWYKPNLKGHYPYQFFQKKSETGSDVNERKTTQKNKKNAYLKKYKKVGIEESLQQILFYKNKETSSPLLLEIGNTADNGYVFARSSHKPSLLLILSDHFVNNFDKEEIYFREKAILYFPENSYIEKIRIHFENKNPITIQHDRKGKGNHPKSIWKIIKDKELPKVFSVGLGFAIENVVKGIKIRYFNDEKEVKNIREEYSNENTSKDVEKQKDYTMRIWEEAKVNKVRIDVSVKKGKDYIFFIRRPHRKIIINGKEIVLLKNSLYSSVHFIDWQTIDILQNQLESIETEIRNRKKTRK